MRKEYILENLDCPTCATKMVVEAAEDKIPAIEKAARAQIRRIEPDTKLVAC